MKIKHQNWIILIALSLTWGSSFILIKQSIAAFTPYQVGSLRMTIAAGALLFFGLKNIKYVPRKKYPWVFLAGAMGNFIPMFLFPFAQQKVSSSVAGILDSLVPVFIILFGYLFFGIKNRRVQIIGAITGFFGAAILMSGGNDSEENSVFHSLLIVLATAFYGMNGLIIKRYLSGIPSFKLSSVLFAIWFVPALIALFLSGFFQDFNGTEEQWKGLGSVFILGFVGTALAMILFYKLIQSTSALFASISTYLMPIVATMWGFLDGEKITSTHLLGAGIILGSVYLIQKTPK